jgi:serine-type D-Ala-D-Ala carboxypeptidase (penicillin-binding protein 5/6)
MREQYGQRLDYPNFVQIFVKEMNKRAAIIGIGNSNFANPHGLVNSSNKSTAHDIALLCSHVLKNALIRQIVGTKQHGAIITARDGSRREEVWVNTNKLLKKGFAGIKTGWTDRAGSCLAATHVHRKVHVIVVVLGCEKKKDRFSETEMLFGFYKNNYKTIISGCGMVV